MCYLLLREKIDEAIGNCTSAKKLKLLKRIHPSGWGGIPVAKLNAKLKVTPDGDDLIVKTASANGGGYKGGKHR